MLVWPYFNVVWNWLLTGSRIFPGPRSVWDVSVRLMLGSHSTWGLLELLPCQVLREYYGHSLLSALSNNPWRRYWFHEGRILHRCLLLLHVLCFSCASCYDRQTGNVAVIAGNIFGWTKLPFMALMGAPEALNLWVWFLVIWSLVTIAFAVAWSRLIDVINFARLLNIAGLPFSSNECAVLFSSLGLATHVNDICECEVWFHL